MGDYPFIKFDVYISYRNVDTEIASILYEKLINEGINTYLSTSFLPHIEWDKIMSNCVILVPIISRESINSSSKVILRKGYRSILGHNISELNENSIIDELLVEYRLGLELHKREMLSYIYPVYLGDADRDPSLVDLRSTYTFTSDKDDKPPSYPIFNSSVTVKSIENKVCEILQSLELGHPILDPVPIDELLKQITSFKSFTITGSIQLSIEELVKKIKARLSSFRNKFLSHQKEKAEFDGDYIDLKIINSRNQAKIRSRIMHNLQVSESKYKARLVVDNNSADTFCSYGLFAEKRKKDYLQAQELYERALNIDPCHLKTLQNYGRFLESVRCNNDAANKLFSRWLELAPKDSLAVRNYSRFCAENNIKLDDSDKLAQKEISKIYI